jgi:hypothetical protein
VRGTLRACLMQCPPSVVRDPFVSVTGVVSWGGGDGADHQQRADRDRQGDRLVEDRRAESDGHDGCDVRVGRHETLALSSSQTNAV